MTSFHSQSVGQGERARAAQGAMDALDGHAAEAGRDGGVERGRSGRAGIRDQEVED